jgi:hypothetical protein
MWELRHRVRALMSTMFARRASPRHAGGRGTDWLPPVLGPQDWSIGLMADRDANWYFDRDRN